MPKKLLIITSLAAVLVAVAFAATYTSTNRFVLNDNIWLGDRNVTLVGELHTVVQLTVPNPNVPPNPIVPVTVHLNLSGVTGVDQLGHRWRATGTDVLETEAELPGKVEITSTAFRAFPIDDQQKNKLKLKIIGEPLKLMLSMQLDSEGNPVDSSANFVGDIFTP